MKCVLIFGVLFINLPSLGFGACSLCLRLTQVDGNKRCVTDNLSVLYRFLGAKSRIDGTLVYKTVGKKQGGNLRDLKRLVGHYRSVTNEIYRTRFCLKHRGKLLSKLGYRYCTVGTKPCDFAALAFKQRVIDLLTSRVHDRTDDSVKARRVSCK